MWSRARNENKTFNAVRRLGAKPYIKTYFLFLLLIETVAPENNRNSGGSTNSTRFTDWELLKKFVKTFAKEDWFGCQNISFLDGGFVKSFSITILHNFLGIKMEFALQTVSVFTKSLTNTTYFAIFYFVKSIIFVMKRGHQCLFLHRSELLYLCNATSNVK